jgi:hypothetical protein
MRPDHPDRGERWPATVSARVSFRAGIQGVSPIVLPYWYGPKAARRDYFWAQVLLQDPQAAATELERTVTELGAQGVSIGGANSGGRQAHDPRGPGSSLPLDRMPEHWEPERFRPARSPAQRPIRVGQITLRKLLGYLLWGLKLSDTITFGFVAGAFTSPPTKGAAEVVSWRMTVQSPCDSLSPTEADTTAE